MTNAVIEVLFGPAPADSDLTAESMPGDDTAVIILWVIATFAVDLRLISRKISRAGLKADVYMIFAALASDIMYPFFSAYVLDCVAKWVDATATLRWHRRNNIRR